MDYSTRELNAIRLYQDCGVYGEQDAYYRQHSAYRAINLLMMPGREGERIRVGIEKQNPDSICITRWEKTLEVMADLFTVQCKYAVERAQQGKPLPNPLERGDRGINFELMRQGGGTIAFTSTSKDEVLGDFLIGKQQPHVLHITLGSQVPYLDFEEFLGSAYSFAEEREVLLPPMVAMTCGACWEEEHAEVGNVRHCRLIFDGFRPDGEHRDEAVLTELLTTHAEAAARGLKDLVARRLEADILRDEGHPYWTWKAAFRRLVLQRMETIYSEYFAE